MVQVKIALFASLTALIVSAVNWVFDLKFISGFISGWWLSGWFQ